MVTLVKILVAFIKIMIAIGKFGGLNEPLSKLESYIEQHS